MMPSPDITVELVGLNWSGFRQAELVQEAKKTDGISYLAVTESRNRQRQLAERKELPREVTGWIGREAVRKRPSEINPDRKEGERWPEGRSESQLQTVEGNELRERQTDPSRDIRPDGRFKPPLVDASPSCSDATGSDPYTNGSRLGYREMVPESDGLIVRILPDGRRCWNVILAVRNRIESPRFVSAMGCGAEYVLTDPEVIRDWFWGAKHG
ncbi:hypothetical protein F2Q69_00059763 [Brassica cretica]|uniref:Uncharacterized protein n=1 Tax=Brassica cretica TaxID=69181 RepID=A0A8S9RMZ5_BRACR|nr:hypothetical protein F2Q69_00059763 [Brassica cretica]